MSDINDGGSAFPLHLHVDHGQGITLRDYFAAAALNGFLAGRNNLKGENPSNFLASTAARDCYRYADAMIEARKEACQ